MIIDSLLLSDALSALPDEAWTDWSPEAMADWLMDWMEKHE